MYLRRNWLLLILIASVSQTPRVLRAQSFTGLGFLPAGDYSTADGVSADGAVIVGRCSGPSSANRAFRWTSATGMVSLGTLPGGAWSVARGVSADGFVVVGEADSGGGSRAFRWTSSD